MTVLLTSHIPPANWWAEVIIEGLTWLFGR
jgi:hypothetical protein